MLTTAYPYEDEPHFLGGTQRIYELNNGCALSCINSKEIHLYPFAWEIAVLHDATGNGVHTITYETPLTNDVEVFSTDEEANAFIHRAAIFSGLGPDNDYKADLHK